MRKVKWPVKQTMRIPDCYEWNVLHLVPGQYFGMAWQSYMQVNGSALRVPPKQMPSPCISKATWSVLFHKDFPRFAVFAWSHGDGSCWRDVICAVLHEV